MLWKLIINREEELLKEIDSIVGTSIDDYELLFNEKKKRVVVKSCYPARPRVAISVGKASNGSFAECRIVPNLIYFNIFSALIIIYTVSEYLNRRYHFFIFVFASMLAYSSNQSFLSKFFDLLKNTLVDIQEAQGIR